MHAGRERGRDRLPTKGRAVSFEGAAVHINYGREFQSYGTALDVDPSQRSANLGPVRRLPRSRAPLVQHQLFENVRGGSGNEPRLLSASILGDVET